MSTEDSTPTILVPLAEGFEEIEAVTIIDTLRRAELDVTVVGLAPGPVRGAHAVEIGTDAELMEVDPDRVRMIVLPGGMPGTTNLQGDERILELLRSMDRAEKPIAAICAAPMVLAEAGILEGRRATSYPACQGELAGAVVESSARVVRDGRLLTSQGPGTSLEFSLAIVEDLCGGAKARELAEAMLLSPKLA